MKKQIYFLACVCSGDVSKRLNASEMKGKNTCATKAALLRILPKLEKMENN